MRIGFIGSGSIALEMVCRLLRAGYQIALYDPTGNIVENSEAAGASMVNTIQDACRWANSVFTMLPNDEAAEAAILGIGGVVENMPRGAVHIGSSTVSVECCDRIVEAHWDAGKEFASAPLLVGSEPTGELQLFAIAGGCEAMMTAVEPLLTSVGHWAQLNGWPSNANRVQLDANRSGANPVELLARHPELRVRQDRPQIASPSFIGIDAKLDIQGVLQ